MKKHLLLVLVLVVALLLGSLGAAFARSPAVRTLAPAAADPVQINFTLEGCRLGTFDEATVTCQDADYVTGNLGKSWNELDLVPHRVTLRNDNGSQTYAFVVSGDYKDGVVGWDFISELTLNTSLSDASCGAATVGALTITPPGGGVGGADQTIYRMVTVTQQAGDTCVYDYYQRVALGASGFSGASLQSNLWNQNLGSQGIGQKRIGLPVNELVPQELSKDMSATQDAEHIWNLTKAPTPAQLNFLNTCDPSQRSQGVAIQIEWTKLPATPSGDITVVTNIYASNPSARTITVNVNDVIRSGETELDTAGSGDVDMPPNTDQLVLTHTATVASGTTDLNDVATATYVDELTGVPVPGQTQATASADVQSSGVTMDQTAAINDVESITGANLAYSADSFSGASGAFDGGYVPGTSTTGSVSWTSATQSDSGSVTFNKTVYVTQAAITSGELDDTATLTGSDGFSTDADASVGISASALVELTINKTIPDILQGDETASFTFYITGPESYSDNVSIDFGAGETAKSVKVAGLVPGQYTVQESADAGWASQPDQTVTIGVPECAGSVTFSNSIIPAKAMVKKVTDPAGYEAGWEFTLGGQGGPEKLTTTGTGFVNFATVLQEGSYTVTETPQAGWDQLQPSADCAFTVDYPADAGREFKCTHTNEGRATKSGVKFEDLNGNGAKDTGEPGLGGWIIELWRAGAKIAEATTGTNGNYQFQNLEPGAYVVCEQLQPDWTQSYPQSGFACPAGLGPVGHSFTLDPGEDETGNDFGNYLHVTKSGTKFDDLNGNGQKDGGEPGVNGVQVKVFDDQGGQVASTTTANGGQYSFSLPPGDYLVCEFPPTVPTWVQSYPGNEDCAAVVGAAPGGWNVTLTSGDAPHTGNDFGNYRLAALGDFVWEDLDADGIQDSGESGIQGATVELYECSGSSAIASTTTDANGFYAFDGLAPGSYKVRFLAPAGFFFSPQNQGSDDALDSDADPATGETGCVTLTSGEANNTLDAGLYKTASKSGVKFNDRNANGQKDSGEPGITGVTVYAYADDGDKVLSGGEYNAGPVDSDTTIAGGSYTLTLNPGTYVVCEEAVAGWIQSYPNSATAGRADCSAGSGLAAYGWAVIVTSGGQDLNNDFGNYQNASKAGRKWHDKDNNGQWDDGEPAIGGWIIELWDSGGKLAEATTDAKGNYQFTNLKPGDYVVCEQLKSGWAQSFPKLGGPGTFSCPANLGLGPIGYSFTLESGENETDNDFGNFALGTIIVEKQTDPDKDPTYFTFKGDAAGSIQDGGQIKKGGLTPGVYTSTELLPASRCTGQPLPEIVFRGARASLKKGQLYIVKANQKAIAEAFTDIVWQDQFGDSAHFAAAVRPHTDMVWDYNAWEVLEGWRDPFLMFSRLSDAIDVTSLGTYEGGALISAVALDHLNHVFQGETRHAQIYLVQDGTETLLGQLEIAEPARITVVVPEPGGEVQIRTHDSTIWWTTCESLDWHLIDITCDDENSTGNLATQTATFNLESGETVTCTFTDQKESAALVGKETDPDGDPARFTFTGDLAGKIGDGSQLVKSGLFKGTYASTELVPDDWDLTAVTCDDPTGDSSGDKGTATATMKVAAGEIVECTFEDEKDGTIVVENQTIPNGNPTSFKFGGDLSGQLKDGERLSKSGLKTGTYTVTESVPDGWGLITIWCDDDNSTGLLSEKRARFRLEAGETVKCVFYNQSEESARPDPSISVSYTPHPATIYEPGGVVDFGVRVVNRGEMAVTLTSLQDDIFGDLTAATADPDEASSNACTLPKRLSADGVYECVYRGQVTGGPGYQETHTVTVIATDDAARQAQAKDTATVTIGNAEAELEVTLLANPSVVAEPGGDVQFTAIVLNASISDNITVSSVVDNKVGDVSGSCTPALPAKISPAGSLTCQYVASVTGTAGDVYKAEVLASGKDDDGGAVSDVGDVEVRVVREIPKRYIYLPVVTR